jgi:uncharacterized iron-regulated protein
MRVPRGKLRQFEGDARGIARSAPPSGNRLRKRYALPVLDRRACFLSLSLLLAGCGAAPRPAAVSPVGAPWATSLDADSTLVGRIWDVNAATWISEDAMVAKLVAARFVLLGEQHDNPDHHRLQARMLTALASRGRSPQVVLEMVDRDRQTDLDATSQDPEAMARVLAWDKSGWPPFSQYRPIFDAAIAGHLPLIAGNLSRSEAKAIVRGGVAGASPETQALAASGAPLSPEQRASLAEELRASHCGQLPEHLIDGMSVAQVTRDVALAEAMAKAGDRGAALIAGAGHTRTDRGAPLQLAVRAKGQPAVSLAFVEVQPGLADPRDYAQRWGVAALPFDFVWFSPRATDEDPCRLIGGRK